MRGDLPGARGAEHRLDEIGELRFELRIRQRVLQRADRVLDAHVHARGRRCSTAVDVGRRLVDRSRRRVACTLRRSATMSRIVDDRVGELVFARAAEDQARRAAVVDAELALQAVLRLLLAGELEHQRMHAQLDALDVLGPARRCSRSCTQASMLGWMTMPQANGL